MVEDTGFRGAYRKSWEGVNFFEFECGICEKKTKHSVETYTLQGAAYPETETKCLNCGASVYDTIPVIPKREFHAKSSKRKFIGG